MTLAPTPSQTVGPFYAIGLCRRPDDELVPPGAPGAVRLAGMLVDGAGDPIVDGVVEVWDAVGDRWGRSGTDGQGRFSFVLAQPEPGPHGAPHLDVYVFARGLLKHQLTRIYFPDEAEANAVDPVLTGLSDADRATLVAQPDGDGLRFDIRMQGDGATVFFVP